ncbi:uncharacterized protein LOC132637796 [Lycium barbarum]|uniref:uncharacterized protein LOC132637796 n=1 Tax=Lycium barbarum TaxID=112863 RepID=UPI00293E7348|nr:uncharacterized protein LOC132637796 [Lycium barbarum]
MHIKFLTAAMEKPYAGEDMIDEVRSMLQELQQLHSLLDTSNLEVANAEQLLKSLQSRKPKLEALLNQCVVPITTEKDCEEKVCGADEKIESPSVTINSESSNKVAEKKQPEKGKHKSKKSKKKGKNKK